MNDFVMLRMARERQEEDERQAEHDSLVTELRRAATPTQPEEGRTAVPAGDPVTAHRRFRALVARVNPRGLLHGHPL